MSTTSSFDQTAEISDENIEILLQQDEGLVEFFNSFLALPCFAERLFYNKDLGVFEEFIEKIADDVGKGDAKAASQLRQFTHFKGTMYNVAGNQSRIGYYVTILDKVQGLEFIKKRRLPLFLRSELYAEYKLSKHLSSVQYSFSRGLFSDGSDDEDSGVEEPIIGRGIDRGRRRSVVSFNLSPAGGTVSTDGDESESDQDFYLPPHIRSIEETFDAWHESFKRPDSRTSMFSSGGGSTPLPRTPQIREQDEFPDTRSSSSCFSAQESDITVSNDGRPVSRISFVSDSSDKGLTPGLGSRVSSASNVSVALEIDSGDESPHDTANSNAEGSHGGSVTNTGEMVRSLSSALSFITENGEVEKVSQPLERVADELAADEELLARTETELDKPSRGRPVGETEQEKERQSGGGIRVEDPISLVPADGTQETLHNERCSVKIPQITETIFADDNDALERESTLTDISVQSNSTISQADEVFPVSSHRITDNNDTARGLEELSERLSEVSEELSDAEEGLSLPEHVEEGLGPSEDITQEDDKESNDIQTLNEEDQESLSSGKKDGSDCLHCQSVQQREEESLSESSKDTSGNTKSMDELLETKDSSIDQESIESSQLDLNSDIFKDLKSTSPRNVEEYDTMKSTKESDVSEAAEEVRNQVEANKGDEENPQTTVEKETASEEQGSLGGKLEEEEEGEEDGEGGYTTEASATTLQGIRGIFSGRRRESTVATSVAFDVDDESAFSDDGSEMEEKPYDLSTKDGFDAFKEFLLGTSGERLLQFWLEVECGRYLERDQEKTRLIQSLRDRFWRSGGIYEFSTGTKTSLNMEDASKLTYDRLYVIQPDILEPLLSYWCIRFTMHQQRRSHSNADLEYTRLVKERPKSCVKRENALSNLPQVPVHAGLAHVLPDKRLTRPQSSSVSKQSSLHQTSRSQIRAKSAHPRLIQTPKYMHTNASSKQLQYIMAPVKTGYGFEQPPGPSFPVEPEPDYLSSVRLFINPVPSPDSKIQRMLRTLHRTAITPGSPKSGCSDETESNTDVMLDSLIQGLIYERQTGNYFESFLQNSGNEVWVNCLAFWKSLQEYNAYFYADSLNPSLLSRKARTMYANFVASGSSYDVLVSGTIQMQVHKELEPPYEELFDAVEEHVLYSLLEPWNMLVKQEKDDFGCEVSKAQVLRHIEIKVLARRRQSIVQTHGGLGSADEEQEKERISVEEANRPLPVPKDGFTFETLIRNREEVEYFKEFLGKKHNKGIKDLMAWTDMETFRRVPRFMDEKRDKKAREIRDSWLGKKYFFGPDGPATREGRNLIMNLNGGRPIKERPSSPVVYESQKFVRARIERRWLMLFKQTAEFLDRQKPRVAGVPELVEDIMLKRRLQRSEAAWKILNSRWVSSSRDVVALRQTLLNPENCAEFCAFVAVKGDTLEGNVQFWLEVQKYKDLCHAHAQPALIHRKIQTIIECFLNSAIAPELQIDIPIEMADKLMERLTGRNPAVHPYVFREAQMTVFRVLFNHWKEFLTYRSKIPEGEDAREHFQEQLRKHRADVKSKKEASERRRLARMSAERKKKEKEEREKRRIEDLASLFSMETASIFYSEEDDLRSWFYSKHLVELERLEHIKRLREQGIILPEEDLVEEKEETKSRRSRVSMAKSSTLSKVGDSKKVHDGASDKKSSEGSSRRLQAKLQSKSKATGQLSPSLARRGSVVSTVQSGTRRNSVVSLTLSRKDTSKDEKNTNKQGDEKEVSPKETVVDNKSERKTSEIQVIHMVPSEIETPNEINPRQNKLLPQRTRSSKRLLSAKQPPKSAGKKRVPLDAISCISDYSVISNIEFAPRGTSARKHGRQGGATLLTSKSLKDFTNSPEGAQLSMPLPLVRITSASHMDKSDTDGSLGEPSALYFKPRPLTQSMRKTPIGPGRPKGLGPTREDIQVKPDVIVN